MKTFKVLIVLGFLASLIGCGDPFKNTHCPDGLTCVEAEVCCPYGYPWRMGNHCYTENPAPSAPEATEYCENLN
jgi:hypothetical protein